MTITTEAPPVVGITADDLAALRKADTITFHLFKGEHYIRCHERTYGGGPRIWTATEQRVFNVTNSYSADERERRIDVTGYVTGYPLEGSSGTNWQAERTTACFHSMGGQYNDEWNTIKNLLKVGDTLRLFWVADNNTETVRVAGLHIDMLRLGITRGTRKMQFLIGVATCKDNSARMVRRHG